MPLAPGARLGPYDILSPLGAGGFGEVYKARDTRLDRTVAIKILPSADPELKARFEREAKAIAALQHPHICTLYDVGHQDGTDYLVMEYLEGETLDKKIAKGPLKIDDALNRATEIADALAVAHRAGIVHRDLKPANVMLTRSGVKLLDFGLAKLRPQTAVSGLSVAATMSTPPMTAQGSILGTLHYMAPEQLEGGEVDARSDIFAFGCVLYEMLTGVKPFDGKSGASIVAAILHVEPRALTQVQPLTPRSLERVITMCLAKDPDHRWQSAHDVGRQLKWIGEPVDDGYAVDRQSRWRRMLWPFAIAAPILMLTAAAVTLLWIRLASAPAAVVRFKISPPPGASLDVTPLAPFAISPDGRTLVFAALSSTGQHLWVQRLDEVDAHQLSGTDNGLQPIWSPNNQSVAFIARNQLKRVDLNGGPARVVCTCNPARAGSWTADGMITFSTTTEKGAIVMRVAASGGIPQAITGSSPGPAAAMPIMKALPDGSVLHIAGPANDLMVTRRWPGEARSPIPLPGVTSTAAFASGYLLFSRDRTLLAQPFDLQTSRFTGDPIALVDRLDVRGRVANFSVSDNGVLVFKQLSPTQSSQLRWFSRSGQPLGVVLDAGNATNFNLSPDGSRLALQRVNEQGFESIWITDLAHGNTSPLRPPESRTFASPVWSPDGREIAFQAGAAGSDAKILRKASSGGPETVVFSSVADHVLGGPSVLTDWSRDGKFLLLHLVRPEGNEIDALSLADGTLIPVAKGSPFDLAKARFSADGRWVAYASSETGFSEIFVARFPPNGERWKVSTNGGVQPRWRQDGKELFYLARDGTVMAVDVRAGQGFDVGAAHALFKTDVLATGAGFDQYTVTPDGNRFLMAADLADAANSALTVVVNWPAALKK